MLSVAERSRAETIILVVARMVVELLVGLSIDNDVDSPTLLQPAVVAGLLKVLTTAWLA